MTVTVAGPTAQKRFEMRVAAFTTLVALAARAIAEPPDLPGDDCWDMPPDLQQLSGSFLQFESGVESVQQPRPTREAAAAAARAANRTAPWPEALEAPAMLTHTYGPLARYITAFGVVSAGGGGGRGGQPAVPSEPAAARPGVVDNAAKTVDSVFSTASSKRGKWGYGYCVCEICHTVVETLQLKLFQDYGMGFQDQVRRRLRARECRRRAAPTRVQRTSRPPALTPPGHL